MTFSMAFMACAIFMTDLHNYQGVRNLDDLHNYHSVHDLYDLHNYQGVRNLHGLHNHDNVRNLHDLHNHHTHAEKTLGPSNYFQQRRPIEAM